MSQGASGRLRPLAAMTPETLVGLKAVLTDIDDTLTTEGRLTAEAYGALEALQASGLLVVPVTGRPAGWCDLIARFWPVDAVVGENGAFYFRYHRETKRMEKRFLQDAATRQANRERLEGLKASILSKVPGTAVASDQAYRESDLAIDVAEDVAPLAKAEVAKVVALFEAAGAKAKVSSIHVNGWFGDFDKLTMTRILLEEGFGYDWQSAQQGVVFLGDSPNDSPLFEAFPLCLGVANVLDFEGELDPPPAFVTERRGGAGFAEFAAALLAARQHQSS